LRWVTALLKLGAVLKIGVHEVPERAQALYGVPLSLLFRRMLCSRILAVGDVLAQTLGPSACLGEAKADADPDPAACALHADAQAPTQASSRPGDAQAGHVAVNQLLTGLDSFDLHRVERRHTL
jgi:hypothetical protein